MRHEELYSSLTIEKHQMSMLVTRDGKRMKVAIVDGGDKIKVDMANFNTIEELLTRVLLFIEQVKK